MSKNGTNRETTALKTKGMNIKTKFILSILPIIVVLLVILTIITTSISRSIITGRVNSEMGAILGQYTNEIAGELDEIKAEADTLSYFVASTCGSASVDEYKQALSTIVKNNHMVLGSGLWFEPYVFDKNSEYYGPYWYKNVDANGAWDKGELIECWDYSNAEYDYFTQEYYTNAKALPAASITDPYYDETSGLVMATCSAPIKNAAGEYLGCVTVDVMLTSVNEKLASIRVGNTGTVWLIDGAGNYVYHPAFENAAADGLNISSSTELGKYMSEIQTKDTGTGDFSYDGAKRLLYWESVPDMTWKMGLTIENGELFAQVNSLIIISAVMCIVIILLCGAVIFLQANSISKAVSVIAAALEKLSNGEFAKVRENKERTDEFGIMIDSTNSVVDTLSTTVTSIKNLASRVADSAKELAGTSEQISHTADDVSIAVQEIAQGATQQADEVSGASTSAGVVGDAVGAITTTVANISTAAGEMSEASKASSDSINNLAKASEVTSSKIDDITATIDATKEAVNRIHEKVEGITAIASQTNLLSLNASIEAARAGEAGRGFAVVAEEIGHLAEDSASMANEIRAEMDTLLKQSDAAVGAVREVKESNISTQNALTETLDSIDSMIRDIEKTVEDIAVIEKETDDCGTAKNSVVDTLSALSAISEENAASCEETGASMQELNATVNTLAQSAKELQFIAEKLNEDMQFFKI